MIGHTVDDLESAYDGSTRDERDRAAYQLYQLLRARRVDDMPINVIRRISSSQHRDIVHEDISGNVSK